MIEEALAKLRPANLHPDFAHDLLGFVDKQVGLEHVLIVLSADHGMAELPEYMAAQGMVTGRLTTDVVLAAAQEIAARQFGANTTDALALLANAGVLAPQVADELIAASTQQGSE